MKVVRLVFALAFAVCCTGYEQNINTTFNVLSRINKVIPWFGLDDGGSVEINVKVSSPGWPPQPPPSWLNVYVSFFNYKQWVDYDLQNFISSGDFSYPCQNDDHQCIQLCSLPSVKRYQVWGNPHIGKQEWNLQFNVSEKMEYTLVIMSCAPSAHDENINVQMDLRMMNPNGEHLSLEKIPLDPMYSILLVIYILFFAACALLNYKFRHSSFVLQPLLNTAIGLKGVEVLTNLAYYRTYAQSGNDSAALKQVTRIGDILSSGTFLGVLLLMSLGWGITREQLTRREKQLFWGVFLLYLIFGLLHSICETPTLCQGYLLSFYVIKFLITFCIIVAMNANIERLRSGGLDLPHPTTPTDLYLKLRIFSNIRWAFLACLVLPIVLMLIDLTVLSWEQEWVGVFLQEMLYLGVYFVIARTFLLHFHHMSSSVAVADSADEGDANVGDANEEVNEDVAAQDQPDADGVAEDVHPAGHSPPPQAARPSDRVPAPSAAYRRSPSESGSLLPS